MRRTVTSLCFVLLLACGCGSESPREPRGLGTGGTGGVEPVTGGTGGADPLTGGTGGVEPMTGGTAGSHTGASGGIIWGGTGGIEPPIGGTGGVEPVTGGTGGIEPPIGGTGGTTGSCDSSSPSCAAGLDCSGTSCCSRSLVPGGTFSRGANSAYPATVSDFCMDDYEVTVGRFRAFVAAYVPWRAAGNPAPGAGEHVPGAGSGWQTSWDAYLPARAVDVASRAACDATYQTWSDTPGSADVENRPINCVDWYVGFAFCIWDGGRLATEAEWEYAAGSGSENRTYAWGFTTPTTEYAAYFCMGDGSASEVCSSADIVTVGSRPLGDGAWGQADLTGNLNEWLLDWFADPYVPASCVDCANVTEASFRSIRGGSWGSPTWDIAVQARYHSDPTIALNNTGLRCVRSPR